MKMHHIENLAFGGIVGITVLSGFLLSFPRASADDGTVSNVAIRVNSACSVAVSPEGSNDTPHTADLNPGTYQANIGKTTIKTTCNDSNGFSIYAIGFTNEEYGNTTLKPESVDSSNSIITGIAASAGAEDTSNWAMKVSAVSGDYAPTIQSDTNGSFSNYHAVPSTFTKVATKSSGTDITTGSSIEITYAAYIAGTQPADLYNGKVKFTMVHPATEQPLQPQTTQSGKICYYPNGSNVDGTMGCQTIPASGTSYGVSPTSATLLASNFSRSGYGFAGWSDKFDYATNNTAKYYGPNETISFAAGQYTGDNNGLSLYAIWIKSAGSLQDSTKVAELCGTTGTNPTTGSLTQAPIDGTANKSSVSALTDERDDQTYAIAKLADGNCWMIENLRLESTASHNTDGSLAQGYDASFIGLADAESANFTDSTTANSLYSTDGSTTATISGSNQSYRFPRYNNTNTSTRASNPTTNSNVNMYSYGNYYTWAAAIADTTAYSSGDHNTTSICPTGWQIPLGNTSTGDIAQGASDTANKVGGFSYLDRKMGGTGVYKSTSADSLRWRKFPLNFVYSGLVDSGSVYNRGSGGFYWSSTAVSSDYAYNMGFSSNYVYPGTDSNDSKYYGWSIRCLAVPSV